MSAEALAARSGSATAAAARTQAAAASLPRAEPGTGRCVLTYRLSRPAKPREAGQEDFQLAMILAVPISVVSSFLGVGPGFLLMPTLFAVLIVLATAYRVARLARLV